MDCKHNFLVWNRMSHMPGVMGRMPPLPVSTNEQLLSNMLPSLCQVICLLFAQTFIILHNVTFFSLLKKIWVEMPNCNLLKWGVRQCDSVINSWIIPSYCISVKKYQVPYSTTGSIPILLDLTSMITAWSRHAYSTIKPWFFFMQKKLYNENKIDMFI